MHLPKVGLDDLPPGPLLEPALVGCLHEASRFFLTLGLHEIYFYLLIGLETLGPRMMKHVSNCEYIAAFLSGREEVSWVSYPGLKSHKDFSLANNLMPKGPGSILSFGIKGGKESAIKFINSLKVFSHLANIGDTKSLVIHPASTTHAQLNKKDLKFDFI